MSRIAVVLIHGIGEQRPMATLRSFVSDVLGSPRSRPDKLSASFEVRRLDVRPKNGPEVDCYEFYWAHHMRDAKFTHLATWLFRLFRIPSADLKKMSKHLHSGSYLQVRNFGIASCLIALALVGVFTWAVAAWTRVAVGVGAVLATIVLVTGKLMWQGAQKFFLKIVTDAARYLDNTPENIGERQIIRAECVKLIGQLNESTVPKYDRIVVIGHSLGSVIAYDALKFLWAMQKSHASLPHSVIDQGATPAADGPLLRLYGRNPVDPVDGPTRQAVRDPASGPSSFSGEGPSLQAELFELLTPDTKWKISNLVTVGSPLTHAPILLSESLEDFWELQKQRELPTSPPRMDPNEVLCGWNDKDGFHLHHAALFAVVEWTNFYLEGDPLGGPLQPLFGEGVRDVRLVLPARRWSNHTRYWSARGKAGCDEFNREIGDIVGINKATAARSNSEAERSPE
jgi:hypothetical protein